jgi:hypothetical protein
MVGHARDNVLLTIIRYGSEQEIDPMDTLVSVLASGNIPATFTSPAVSFP